MDINIIKKRKVLNSHRFDKIKSGGKKKWRHCSSSYKPNRRLLCIVVKDHRILKLVLNWY